ncbi:hypothetical protein [Nocardioides sediminis]|nr:hypothetical protein [Nocardioides sediminis]
MTTSLRWAVAVLAALLVVALLVWARGEDHHRGDDVGALARVPSVAAGR